MSTIADMLRRGHGATGLPLAVLEREIARGLLVELPVSVRLASMEVRCVHLTGTRRNLAGEIFASASAPAQED